MIDVHRLSRSAVTPLPFVMYIHHLSEAFSKLPSWVIQRKQVGTYSILGTNLPPKPPMYAQPDSWFLHFHHAVTFKPALLVCPALYSHVTAAKNLPTGGTLSAH